MHSDFVEAFGKSFRGRSDRCEYTQEPHVSTQRDFEEDQKFVQEILASTSFKLREHDFDAKNPYQLFDNCLYWINNKILEQKVSRMDSLKACYLEWSKYGTPDLSPYFEEQIWAVKKFSFLMF